MELLKKSNDKEEEDDDAERVLAEAAAAAAESKRTDMFMVTEDKRLKRRDAESRRLKQLQKITLTVEDRFSVFFPPSPPLPII